MFSLFFSYHLVGYPDSNEGQNECIKAMDPYSYTFEWINDNCELRMPFVCEVIASSNPTTIAPPTPTPETPCNSENPNDGWLKFTKDQGGTGEYCFYFYNDWETKNWMDARKECEYKGGRLASIHSEQENTYVTRKMASQGYYTISWIGLEKDYGTGQFIWIDDGTAPDFLGWGDGGMFLLIKIFWYLNDK